MIRPPISKAAAKELAKRAVLAVLDPDSNSDVFRLARVLRQADDMIRQHSVRDILRDLAGGE